MSDVRIRPAAMRDLEPLARLQLEAECAWQQRQPDMSYMPHFLETLFVHFVPGEPSYPRVACQDLRLVGGSVYSVVPAEQGLSCVGMLRFLHVAPDTWGEGIGHALMEDALGQMIGQGVRKVALETAGHNCNAIRFFRRHGFARVGKRTPIQVAGSSKQYYMVSFGRTLP